MDNITNNVNKKSHEASYNKPNKKLNNAEATSNQKTIIFSLLLITFCSASFLLQHYDILRLLTQPLHHQLDNALKETALTFAATRAVNAVISLVQESSFGFSLGINISIAAGQILDPLNDLIERFSQLTLACLVALSIQKVLLDLGIVIATSILIPLSGCIGLLSLWWQGNKTELFQNMFHRLSIISLFTLLGLPFSIVATNVFDHLLLSKQIDAANGRINQVSEELADETASGSAFEDMTDDVNQQAEEPGFFERLKRSGEQTHAQLEQSKKVLGLLDQIQALDTDTLIEDIILLCGLYLLRALLLPIIMLWLTYRTGLYFLSLLDPNHWHPHHQGTLPALGNTPPTSGSSTMHKDSEL